MIPFDTLDNVTNSKYCSGVRCECERFTIALYDLRVP